MLRDNFVYCNFCLVYMGQLWNLSPVAPGLLPAPDLHVCDQCSPAPVQRSSDHLQGLSRES